MQRSPPSSSPVQTQLSTSPRTPDEYRGQQVGSIVHLRTIKRPKLEAGYKYKWRKMVKTTQIVTETSLTLKSLSA